MKKTNIAVLFLCSFLFSTFAYARLGDGIQISKMKIDAKTEVGFGYDDNILLEADNEIHDTFFHIRPYVDFEAPFSQNHKLYMSADADLYRFSDYTAEDSTSYVFLAGYDFTLRNFYGTLLEEYIMPEDRDGILYTNKIERTNNIPSLLLGFDFNRFAIEGIYRKEMNRYDSSEYARDEYDENNYTFGLYWHAFTKTDLLLEYNYGDLNYRSENRDGEYYQVRAGLKGEITAKITGTLKVGYQDRSYEVSDEEFQGLAYESDLEWKISDSKSVDLKLAKGAKESLILGNDFYKLNRVSLELKHESVARGILVGVGGFFENDKFPFTDNSTLRDDDVYELFLRLGFKFNNWLTVEAKYKILDRDSNYDAQDYTQHLSTLYATLKL